VTAQNSRGAGGLNAPSASAALDNIDQSVAFGNTISLSSTTVNETRAQIVHGDLNASPTDSIGPAVSITGVASFGTLSGSPTRRVNKMYELVDNLSHQVGPHSLRAGVDFLYNDDTITFPRSNRGSYSFSSLTNFLAGTYASFSQTFGATQISQTNPNLGVYAQDEWKAARDLTVNAGVRYDVQWLRTIMTDTNNVSPRIGMAWSPFGSSRTVVRASAGLFYDRVPLRALANALLSAGNTTTLSNLQQPSISLTPTQAGAPTFPGTLSAAVPNVTLISLSTMDPHLQNAHSRQAGVEVERQLGARTTVSVGYQYLRGLNLLMSVNQNVPTCVSAGTNNGCRPISIYANSSQYSSVADSTYHAMTVSLIGRPTAWGYYRVSYTLSKAMDDVGEAFFSSPIDPTNIMRDWGRSDDDQRHRVVISAGVSSPAAAPHSAREWLTHGFELSGSLQYYSALPFNVTSGVTNLQGTTSRPLAGGAVAGTNFDTQTVTFIPRNAGTGPDYFSLNMRLSRSFRAGDRARIEALVEGFNLTNRENVATLNGNFGSGAYPANPSSTFDQATGVYDPRAFQLAARVSF
jgi:hypothetical protein